MKFRTYLSRPVGRLIPYLTAGFLLLSLVCMFLSVVLIFSARDISGKMLHAQQQLKINQSTVINLPPDLLPRDKLSLLQAKIQSVNELTKLSGPTLPMLVSRLEKIIPDSVWIVTLQYRATDNESKLVVAARSPELLIDFMGKLEQSGYFKQVLLTRQTQINDKAAGGVQFEIQLKGGI